ncbi:MAG: hypothetical protein GVY20_15065 [Bacteroidetes bacterium]|nr:hypothetical protein [Bacteroidota bacterium]
MKVAQWPPEKVAQRPPEKVAQHHRNWWHNGLRNMQENPASSPARSLPWVRFVL